MPSRIWKSLISVLFWVKTPEKFGLMFSETSQNRSACDMQSDEETLNSIEILLNISHGTYGKATEKLHLYLYCHHFFRVINNSFLPGPLPRLIHLLMMQFDAIPCFKTAFPSLTMLGLSGFGVHPLNIRLFVDFISAY